MRKEWTPWEVQYLEKKYHGQPVSKTARILNRSVSSVKHKAQKIGLNHYADNLNAKTIAKCFNNDISVVLRWINKLGLPAYRLVCETQTRYLIDPIQFWKWAEEHKTDINWSGYELGSIMPEPEWVKESKEEFKNKNTRKRFTEYEKLAIKSMLRKGISYREIANEIGRTYNSVNRICRTIYM